MKPKYSQLFRAAAAVISLPSLVTLSHAATDNFWDGSESKDWNTALNWSADAVPTKVPGDFNAVVNTSTPNIATIMVDVPSPVDIFVARGPGITAQLNHTAGSAATGVGNWMFVGRDGATGTYNLANTAGAGGSLTGFAQGTGNMTVSQRLYIGGSAGTGATGTVNVNTSGTLAVGTLLEIGTNASTGILNIDAGTVSGNDWIEIGNGAGSPIGSSKGTLNMSGGTLTKTGPNNIIVGANGSIGEANIGGGSIITSNNQTWVGNGGGSVGTLNLSGTASITGDNAFSIGRATATGIVNMTGGKITKTGGNNFAIGGNGGANDNGGTGTLTQSAGDIAVNSEVWVGNAPNSVGVYNLNGGSIANQSWVALGRQGATGTVNMSGGTWTKTGGGNFIVGAAGPGTMNMSGGIVTTNNVTWVGEQNGSVGLLKLTSEGDYTTPRVILGVNTGANGTLHLDGGTLRTSQITGGPGTSTVNFNGGKIVATAAQASFIETLGTAQIQGGGLRIDSQGFALSIAQGFTGAGGVIKTGAGSLALTGTSSFTGDSAVDGGTLTLTAGVGGGGNYTVADGATLNASVSGSGQQIVIGNLTLGTTGGAMLTTTVAGGNPTLAPLKVNNLQSNGTTLVNFSETFPSIGTFSLVSFTSRSGTGTFQQGTFPRGVQGTVTETANSIDVNITRAVNLAWDGGNSNLWSGVNWVDLYATPTTPATLVSFQDGDPVIFDDFATVFNVVLNSTVLPATTDFNNGTSEYTITGTGTIGGSGGLLKQGGANTTIGTANTYTGITRIEAGTLSVANLGATAGAATPLGAATADPAKLVLAGGTLAYTGPAATSLRGFTVAGNNSVISNANDLTLSGAIATTSGTLQKLGVGNLTLTNPSLVIGTGNPGLRVSAGTLTLTGAGAQTTTVSGEMWVAGTPDVAANLVLNQTSLTVANFLAIGRGNGTTGTVSNLTATGSTIQTGNFSAGFNNGIVGNLSTQNITLNNSTWNNGGVILLAESGGSTSTLTLNGASALTSNDNIYIGTAGLLGTLNLNGTSTVESKRFVVIGRNTGGTGVANITSGTLTQSGAAMRLIVSENTGSTGTLNVSGTGKVIVLGDSLLVAPNANTNGTVNLGLGGLIEAKVVTEGAAGGTSAFNFDGGTLRATAPSTAFMAVDTVTVSANGGTVDSNGNDITIAKAVTGAGGLTKTGGGTLRLNGANTNSGTTTVGAGTLGGTGSLAGPLVVNGGATLNPGAPVGTFSATSATFNAGSTLAIDIDDTQPTKNDTLAVTGVLDISGAALQTNAIGTPASLPYTIATFGSLVGTFASVPAGTTVSYNANSITLTAVSAGTPFQVFINGFTSIPVGQRGQAADPDGDGQSNILEYALGGDPSTGGSNARIFSIVADGSADADTDKELLMTIAVLQGTPTFTGSPLSATMNGVTYVIEGSTTLNGFPLDATPVNVVAPPTPNATPPANYEYRTFSLNGSNGTPGKGFMRVRVNY